MSGIGGERPLSDQPGRKRPTLLRKSESSLPLSIARQSNIVLASLLVVTVLAWVGVVQQANSPMGMAPGGLGLTMGMNALAFVLMWTVMMVGMMFPASAPMIAVSSQKKAEAGGSRPPTWLSADRPGAGPW